MKVVERFSFLIQCFPLCMNIRGTPGGIHYHSLSFMCEVVLQLLFSNASILELLES